MRVVIAVVRRNMDEGLAARPLFAWSFIQPFLRQDIRRHIFSGGGCHMRDAFGFLEFGMTTLSGVVRSHLLSQTSNSIHHMYVVNYTQELLMSNVMKGPHLSMSQL